MMYIFFLSCSYYHIVLLSLLKKPFVVYDGRSLVIFQEIPIYFSFLLSLNRYYRLIATTLATIATTPREIQDKFADVFGNRIPL